MDLLDWWRVRVSLKVENLQCSQSEFVDLLLLCRMLLVAGLGCLECQKRVQRVLATELGRETEGLLCFGSLAVMLLERGPPRWLVELEVHSL